MHANPCRWIKQGLSRWTTKKSFIDFHLLDGRRWLVQEIGFMSRIQKLSEDLISKIAAGEVIERPFSVVKELVENSIDAGASEIQVDVEEGGRKKIVILDNGIGMTAEEADLALQRHATSKIRSDDDLFNIRTLGFRGEAMPSIAAISFMGLETVSAQEGEIASKLEIEGGRVVKRSASPLTRGTRISIERLFFNTPARLKFLKSKETEFSHISNWLESMALCRPDIQFILKHQGKTELYAPAVDDLRWRIKDVLGEEIAEFSRKVDFRRGDMAVYGYVTDHRVTSTSSKSIFFFVNGRMVRDRTLQHAVMAAYENLLMHHRYPWVVLHLTVPPDFVDVNVHPTKSEVKFAQSNLVHELVRSALRDVLQGVSEERKEVLSGSGGSDSGSDFLAFAPANSIHPAKSVQLDGFGGLPLSTSKTGAESDFSGSFSFAPAPYAKKSLPLSFVGNEIRVIGQVHQTYLLCETSDKLILIDQHAAHERIGFEKLKRQLEEGGIHKQQLLIPRTFDLRPSQGEILKKYAPDLAQVGLEIEHFGGNTFLLRSLPTLLERTDVIELIEDMVDSLQSVEKLTPFHQRIHEILERMACHAQVRAGDALTTPEIEALISEMRKTNFAGQCPHGRPSVLEVPFTDMEKWFKRRV